MKNNIYMYSGVDLYVENIYLKQQLCKINNKLTIKHLKKLKSKILNISKKLYRINGNEFSVYIDKHEILSCIHNFILDLRKRS